MAIKQRPDSPTNNFATLNPLAILLGVTVSNGNLTNTTSTDNDRRNVFSSIAAPKNSGKFYAEFCVTTVGNSDDINVGVSSTVNTAYQNYLGGSADAYAYWGIGRKINNNSYSTYGSAFSTAGAGGIIGVLIDTDNGDLTFYLNNSSMGTAYTGINFEEYFFGIGRAGDSVNVYQVNFGQDPTFNGNKTPSGGTNSDGSYPDKSATGIGGFFYEPPAGALALCTANLEDITPDVDDDVPGDYMKAVIWSGTTYANSTVPVGFQPDLVWAKCKNVSGNHRIVDSVRGDNGSVMYELSSNDTGGEGTDSSITGLSTNGIDLGSGNFGAVSGQDIVAWCFRAGGSPSATDDGTGVSGSAKLVDTSGTASSTTCKSFKDAAVTAGASNVICPSKMSINQKAGFSIIKYTGTGSAATIPHGLSSAPEMVICKTLDTVTATNWVVYFKGATTNSQYLMLNSTGSVGTYTNYWGTAEPTNNVFSVAAAEVDNNHSNANIIAYCWHSVAGYSAFGSYTGNGSTTGDGPFVYTGFKPAWIMIKNTSISENWTIRDAARTPYNPNQLALYSNLTNGDDTACPEIDFLSNGFKLRANQANLNQSNGANYNYIYAAFAEQPTKYANAR